MDAGNLVGIGARMLVALFAVLGTAGGWTADSTDPFAAAIPENYPRPVPISSVTRLENLEPYLSLALSSLPDQALGSAENRGARIELLQVVRSDEIAGTPAPAGMEAVILVTRWHNIHPRQKVARAQLESGADRSYGAGGLFGSAGKPDPGEMVELDVAYQVRQPGQHAWLVTGGETYALHTGSKALPGGVGPLDVFTLTRFGEEREARFGWFVPKGSTDIELRFFDYEFGSIHLLVAGDAANAAKAPALQPVDSGRLDELELTVLGSSYADRWNEVTAPAGWRYLVTEILGKSIAEQAGKGALVYADPTHYLWALGDGSTLRYGQPPTGGARTLTFTPELPHRQSVAFLVPAKEEAYRIGIRGRSGVLSLRATVTEPAAPAKALASTTDTGALELALLGLRWDDQVLVADLLATPEAGSKGVELDTNQQFLLKAGNSEYRSDTALTARLYRGPPAPFVIPPDTAVGFELAFSLPMGTEPAALRYRGFAGESLLRIEEAILIGSRGVATGLLAATAPPLTVEMASSAPEARSGIVLGGSASASVPAPGAAAALPAPDTTATVGPPFVPPKTPPKLMPLALPPFDLEQNTAEKEPNDTPVQSTPLGKGLAAAGTLSAQDRVDWFSFDVTGEPQLWSLEASGTGLRHLGIYTAGERKLSERDIHDKASVRIDALQLLPARYWVKVTPSSTGGDYRLRAVPLGRPDRDSEFEPNDHPSQAQILRFGEPRQGLVGHQDDRDMYRFSIGSATYLAIELTSPPDLKLAMNIESDAFRVAGDQTAKPGDASRYVARLQAGDYQVTVHGDGRTASDRPYQIKLDYLDPFDQPTDLEPNDQPALARSLEQVRRFSGSVGRFGREDWFQLPAVEVPTTVSLRYTGKAGLNLRRVESGSMKYGKLIEAVSASTGQSRNLSTTLEPGVPAYLQLSGGGDYAVELVLEPEPVMATARQATGGLELSAIAELPPIAAFREETQRLPLAFSVTNRSDQPQRVSLESVSAADGWRILPAQDDTLLKPGESASLQATLIAGADLIPAERLPLFVRARSDGAASPASQLPIRTLCGVPAQSPERDTPLPAALLGGFNLAWQALGADPVGDDATRGRQALLFDGMTPLNQALTIKPHQLPADITVELAGGVTPVAGIALFPARGASDRVGPVPFALLTSTDGAAYSEIFHGVLEPAAREQPFVLAEPVRASHLRLHLENPAGLQDGFAVALAEFKVIAAAGVTPFGLKLPNIADPAVGGHLVSVSWPGHDHAQLHGMLTEAAENQTSDIDRLVPIDWVIGFHHQRAARITRLEWQENTKADSHYRRAEQVAVAASVEGPNGPWTPLANWELVRDADGKAALGLKAPVWARYLRFSVPSADRRTRWQLAETLRVFEQAAGTDYGSILAEWGQYRREAFYETSIPDEVRPADQAQGGGSDRETGRALANAEIITGRAAAGVRDEWYRIQVPSGLDRLELRFGGNGRSRLLPVLESAEGNAIPLDEADDDVGQRVFHARVTGGSEVWLKVTEASRSIMIVWDNSASVRAYHDGMYQAIARLADDIKPGLEVVNLMPLRDGGTDPLMSDWSSNAIDIKAAIGGYGRSDSSSDSEKTLITAMERLAKRPGNRAIVLLTDAESPGDRLNSTLWQRFREVRPRLFTLELQIEARTEKVAHYQDLMQNWAAVNHGDYRTFRSQADLDHAFERAACLMRRPADYSVSWRPAPGKGELRVMWESGKAMAGAAMELVLDASGSMRSAKAKVGGKLKMEVAREVMHEIVNALPDDTQVGLRFYGHRRKDGSKGACEDSELVTPITLIDRARLGAAVDKVQALGSTPIAYSISRACEDLSKVKGPKLLVVITDGKEECEGDPAAAVAACRAAGLDLRMDIIGFALADAKDKSDMEIAATRGGGRFFDAQDRGALVDAIAESLAMPFEVFDSHETSVGQGLTGSRGQPLYQGNYSVVVRTANGDVTVHDVVVTEKKTSTIYLARDGDAIRFRAVSAQ